MTDREPCFGTRLRNGRSCGGDTQWSVLVAWADKMNVGTDGLAVNAHRFDLFLVAVPDRHLGHLCDVSDLSLGLLFVAQ